MAKYSLESFGNAIRHKIMEAIYLGKPHGVSAEEFVSRIQLADVELKCQLQGQLPRTHIHLKLDSNFLDTFIVNKTQAAEADAPFEVPCLVMGGNAPSFSLNADLDVRTDAHLLHNVMTRAMDGSQFKLVEIPKPKIKNKIDWSHVHENFVRMVVEPRPYGATTFLIDDKNCRKIKAEMYSSFVRGNSDETVYRPEHLKKCVGACYGARRS